MYYVINNENILNTSKTIYLNSFNDNDHYHYQINTEFKMIKIHQIKTMYGNFSYAITVYLHNLQNIISRYDSNKEKKNKYIEVIYE